MEKREIRVIDSLRLREAEDGKESRIIEGYAIVFNRESVVLCDWCEEFREIILPEAVSMELLDNSDIKMNLWHDREKLIARRNKGKGSLEVGIDEHGVFFRFEAPNTPDGNTALELVKRGDLAGCSFAYSCNEKTDVEYVRGEKEDDPVCRRVKHIEGVYDMTICSDPAYQDTSVAAREAIEGLLKPEPVEAPAEEETPVSMESQDYLRTVEELRKKAKQIF